MGFIDNLIKSSFGTYDEDDYGAQYIDRANEEIQDMYKNMNLNRKSAKQHYEAGREIAGMEASDKAGEAKRTAKATAMMNDAGKMTAAVQGAQAAADASSKGYDEAANVAASMSQAQEQAQRQDEINKTNAMANSIMTAAQNKANAKANANEANRGVLGDNKKNLLTTFTSLNK